MRLPGFDRGPRPSRALLARDADADALVDSYVAWREACVDVRTAYDRWSGSESACRGLSFAAYMAALEHEEHAADAYRRRIERARRVGCRPTVDRLPGAAP
jgi:hypothetical protein